MDADVLILTLGFAALFAGFVDAVVGGGGLVQIPALFSAFPTQSPAVLLATNKVSSIVGTASAAVQYARRVRIPWAIALPGAVVALAASWLGAKAVVLLPPELMRPFVLLLLVLVATHTFIRKDLGTGKSQQKHGRRELIVTMAIAASVGFYDGLFGPGTGSFLIFLFVRFLALDFIHAAATAKIVNVATNLGAIAYFSTSVEVLWVLGATMALCNLCGAIIGSRIALARGSGFVRLVFLGVVMALIVKMSYDMLVAGCAGFT